MIMLCICIVILIVLNINLQLKVDRYKNGLITLNDQLLNLFIAIECIRKTIKLDTEDIDVFIKNFKEELDIDV